ncbi:MAG: hypothetical protein GWP36_00075 [Bacteroidetes bacterium]|nr:hypothetical protein [Bacteroidota bacterium]
MHKAIKAVMNELVKTPPSSMPHKVTELARRRWMADTEAGPIVQLELLESDKRALVYATTARDGSGPLRTPFITMLLLEDTIANTMLSHGVCSGEATVTVYRYASIENATAESIAHEMMDFAALASALLAKRCIGLPGAPFADDRDVA